jgi:hypothetical protein
MKAIELLLPNNNPTIIALDSIRSVALQPKSGDGAEDSIIIVIDGWTKPFVYESQHAKNLYARIQGLFEITAIKLDAEKPAIPSVA